MRQLRQLSQNILDFEPTVAWQALLCVRNGGSVQQASEVLHADTTRTRKLVSSVGRILGQSLKNKERYTHGLEVSNEWTRGRGSRARSYQWVMTASEDHVRSALGRALSPGPGTPQWGHYLDCWNAANHEWLDLGKVVRSPSAAAIYVKAGNELESRLRQLRLGSLLVIQACGKGSADRLDVEWSQGVSWHLPSPRALRMEEWCAAVMHQSRRKDLAVRGGLRSVALENLGPLLGVEPHPRCEEREQGVRHGPKQLLS